METKDSAGLSDVVESSAGWKEVDSGLKQALIGYAFLLPGVGLTLVSGWLGTPGSPLYHLAREMTFLSAELLTVGTVFGVSGALFGAVLLAMGQYRCLSNLPPDLSAKDMMFVCVLCFAAAALVWVGSLFAGGGENSLASSVGLDWPPLEALTPKVAAQLLSVILGMCGFYVFNHVLRSIATYMDRPAGGARVDAYLVAMGCLVGISFAALLNFRRLAPDSMVWPVLVSAWLAGFVGHLVRIDGVRKRIKKLLATSSLERARDRLRLTSRSIPKALSGVRRVLRTTRSS
jgi:hypothetical protein